MYLILIDGKVFLTLIQKTVLKKRKEDQNENTMYLKNFNFVSIMKKHGFEDTVMKKIGFDLQWILQKSMDLNLTTVQKNYIKMF